ncbi:hypothetical protein MBELCI_0709 [Limimaricola cinnabarinus LL-001]|uniref:Uncharacterized protein n=1 Tax=Limimaricola cinnabarinus LL-001 TaxID=1337093 RepID=U2Z0N3_9RHOB|nr:hypothetical protein MBELCI_0709 [Limimaricola cinnabarinus LL-001]
MVSHGPCSRTQPLVGVAHAFHKVIGGHILHKTAPGRGHWSTGANPASAAHGAQARPGRPHAAAAN